MKVPRWISALTPTLACFVLVELVLRVGGFDVAVRPLEVRAADEAFRSHLKSAVFEPDRETFWRPRASVGPFNAQGYRGAVLARKRPGELRIVAAGDSNTLGHAATWVDELGRIEPAALGAETISVANLGVYGYTSYQGKLRLRRFMTLEPDVVLISFGGNDAAANDVEDASYRGAHSAWWLGKLRLVDGLARVAVAAGASRSRSTPPPVLPRVSLEQYARNLEEMIELARGAGAEAVLLTRPFVSADLATGPDSRTRPYREATLAAGRQSRVPVIDVDAIAGHQPSLFDDHSHFGVRGHAIVGERIAKALVEILRTGTYDLEALRYRSVDPFETLSNRASEVLRLAPTLEEGLERLTSGADVESVGPIAEIELRGATARFGLPPGRTVETRGRRVCFPLDEIGGVLLETALPGDGARAIWLELVPSGWTAVRVAWSEDDAFDDRRSLSEQLERSSAPKKVVAVVPPGARRLRAVFYAPAGPVEPCLVRLAVVSILPARSSAGGAEAGSSRPGAR